MKRDETEETVLDMAKKLRTYADAVHSPTHARIAALETRMRKLENKIENHKKLKQDILQISAVQGNTAIEVFEKGEKIIQILLKASFAIKKSKIKEPAREIQFLGVKWHDGRRQIPTEVINKITAMCPPTNKRETQAFLSAISFWKMHIPEYSQIDTPEARKVLEEVQQAVSACQVYHIEPSIDVILFITTPDLHPTDIISQWNDDWTDPLHILEWVFLPHQPHKTVTALFELIVRLIIKCQQRCLQLMGADPSKIILPVQREEFDWSYMNNVLLQSALEGFSGQITYHLPSHKLLQVAKNTQFSLRPKNSQEPVQGPTVFTDGSGKTGKAIVTWQDGSEWQVLESHEDGSAQLVELRAAVMAFEKFSQEPFNLITDSAYVADIAQRLSCSVLKEVSNPALFDLLKALWCAIQARVHPYHVLHVRSHTNLPGYVAEGNARADKLANPAWVAPQPDVLAQAKASHGFFHQNSHTLQKQFQLTATEAREIVESCDDCHALGAPLLAGVNPRGLKALELWQTDVTQVTGFGWLKCVHVMVDTFSSAMWASAHTGEKARDVIAHWRQAFAILGIPSAVKSNNGPAYASQQASDGEQQPRAKTLHRPLWSATRLSPGQSQEPNRSPGAGRHQGELITETGLRYEYKSSLSETVLILLFGVEVFLPKEGIRGVSKLVQVVLETTDISLALSPN
ncbi:hypothetical protein DUI87_02683 [Hirundo rustica rustica]|uniref:RNA-directed DNA polymerase n=1 Tax=Hirundo rustica rustica TaxID=333673 RepID=A0A3M0LCX7_HIRRU|nr:hypothetical protein DUI87_02683 [Hirundo rustica rustica]